MRFPWLEAIPGGNSDRTLPFLPHLDRYSPASQDRILKEKRQAGYTHFTLSWPDSRDGAGQSIPQYVETAKRVKQAGMFVDHHFFAKPPYDSQNSAPENAYGVIDALLSAGVLDIATVGWEMNAFLQPGSQIQNFIDKISLRVRQSNPIPTPVYLHFLPHYAAWQTNSESPHDFWMRQSGKVTGLKYQADPDWDAGMTCARTQDVLVRLGPGGLWGTPGFSVVAWETSAMTQWNGGMSEVEGDLIGYEQLCTPGPIHLSGYGNGCRYPDGTAV